MQNRKELVRKIREENFSWLKAVIYEVALTSRNL